MQAASTPTLRPASSGGSYPTDPFAPTEVDVATPRPAGTRPQRQAPPEVPGYRIEEELARGGMGVVYRATDVELERQVALKVLRDPSLAGPHELERFRVEAKAAAALQHPGIVAVHSYGETYDGLPYLVMDLVEGESLAARLHREGPLPPRDAARLIKATAEALAAAHAEGVLHRDLKPANVLLDREGTPRLTDFGLAKRIQHDEGLTFTGQILGTPSYMAPEQAEGEGRVDVRSDVYGLGATLYQLLTGRPPFEGNNPWHVLSAVLMDEPSPPRELRPELDLSIEAVCLRCLERAPDARYPNAAALAADLGRYLANEPVEARPLTPGRKALRTLKRYRARLVIAAFLICMGLGAAALVAASRADQAPFERLDQARSLLRLDRATGEVEAEVDAALKLGGDRERVKLEAARVFVDAGLLERARTLLEQAVRDHPPGVAALLELHRLEVGGGASRFTPALKRLLEASREAGRDDAYGYYARGEAVFAEDPQRALTAFEAALERAPRFTWARLGRAAALDRLGRAKEAEGELDATLKADPALAHGWFMRARLHADAGRHDQARRDLTEAERRDPRSGWVPYRLGLLELRLERLDPAVAALRRSVERFRAAKRVKGQALALGACALAEKERGDTDQARVDAAAAVALDPSVAKARFVLAEIAAESGKEAEALPLLNAALKADPDLVPALILRGRLRGDLKDLERAVHLAPRSTEARRARAFALAQVGELKRARKDLDVALGLDPGDAKAYDMRADVRQLASDWAGAELDYSNAITADGTWPDPRIKRGVLRAKRGRPQEARRDWEAALKHMKPNHPRRSTVEAWLGKVPSGRNP